MNYSTLNVQTQDAVIRVQMHRPEANNGINARLVRDLTDAIEQTQRNPDLRVFVLEGLPEVFCSGNDFQSLAQKSGDELSSREDIGRYYDVLQSLTEIPLTTVALIRGRVNAGGVGFAAACDLSIVHPEVNFALSEMLFGLLPACVLPFVVRRVGFQRAKLLALTTQPICAKQAVEWGLADEVDENLERRLRLRTARLACLEREAIGRLKTYVNQLSPLEETTRTRAIDTIEPLIADPKIRAAIGAFIREGIYPWQANTKSSS